MSPPLCDKDEKTHLIARGRPLSGSTRRISWYSSYTKQMGATLTTLTTLTVHA